MECKRGGCVQRDRCGRGLPLKPRVVGCHAASVCLTVVVLCISFLSLRDPTVIRTRSGLGLPDARVGLRLMTSYTAACTGLGLGIQRSQSECEPRYDERMLQGAVLVPVEAGDGDAAGRGQCQHVLEGVFQSSHWAAADQLVHCTQWITEFSQTMIRCRACCHAPARQAARCPSIAGDVPMGMVGTPTAKRRWNATDACSRCMCTLASSQRRRDGFPSDPGAAGTPVTHS